MTPLVCWLRHIIEELRMNERIKQLAKEAGYVYHVGGTVPLGFTRDVNGNVLTFKEFNS